MENLNSAFSVFQEVVASYTGSIDFDEKSVPDNQFKELGVDSLAMVRMIVDLESSLRLTLPDDILTPEAFSSPSSLWRALEPHVGNARQ